MKITIDTEEKTISIKDNIGNIDGLIQRLNEIFSEKWKQWDLTFNEVPYTYFDTIELNEKAEVSLRNSNRNQTY